MPGFEHSASQWGAPPSLHTITPWPINPRTLEIPQERRLQPLRQAESVADTEEDDDGQPPLVPTPPNDPHSTPSLDDTIKSLENLLNELLDDTTTGLQAADDCTQTLEAQHDAKKSTLLARIQDLERQNAALRDESDAQNNTILNLARQLIDSQQQVVILLEVGEVQGNENAAQDQTICDLKSTVQKTRMELSILTKEKKTWQQKLDGMHNRLHHAERQLRCLDHVTRAKLDSRQSGLMADIKRSPLFASKGLGAEILNQITALNSWIRPTAQLLAKDFERLAQHRSYAQVTSRSVEVFGEGMSGLLQIHANEGSSKIGFKLLQTVMEIFLVHWAMMIIEAWYPKQKSFADILVELSVQKYDNCTGSQIQCGVPVRILNITPPATDFQSWALEILKDLDNILLDANVAFSLPPRGGVQRALVTLAKKAYNLRTSLAERDLCGHIQLAHVSPDTLFQDNCMKDVHQARTGVSREDAIALMDAERVAGTCRLGLQVLGSTPGTVAELVLKPQVALLSKLQESL